MKRRAAFSLIELVLAISLSIALVALLGFAIDSHLVRLDSSRTTIEQAQLARALMDRITADLRAVTTAPVQDVSVQMAAAESAAKFNVDQVDQSATADDSATQDGSTTEAPPGLYGTFDTLTIDTRQCWQYTTIPTAGGPGAAGVPVTRVGVGWMQIAYGMSQVAETPGLVRTETQRDTVRWRTEQGQTAPVVTPLAAEVRGVRFRYFDGQQLIDTWDTSEQGVLPAAVEVLLELAPADTEETLHSNAVRQTTKTYRRVVRLPAAADETDTAEETAADDPSTQEGV